MKGDPPIFTEAEELKVKEIIYMTIAEHSKACPNFLKLRAWAAGIAVGCGICGFAGGIALTEVLKKLFGV